MYRAVPRTSRTTNCTFMKIDAAHSLPALSAIVQYYKHAATLQPILNRLLSDPQKRLEVIVHADSNTTADRAAFAIATSRHPAPLLRVLHSDNLHELRGYNLAAQYARAPLILFMQDDYLPPTGSTWIDFVLGAFSSFGRAGLGLDALGLTAAKACPDGPPIPGQQRCVKVGQCGGYAQRTTGGAPIAFMDVLVMGPIVVRRSAFRAVGGFNISYSRPGKPGLGFEGAFSSHLCAPPAPLAPCPHVLPERPAHCPLSLLANSVYSYICMFY
jgi:hypothetical protein